MAGTLQAATFTTPIVTRGLKTIAHIQMTDVACATDSTEPLVLSSPGIKSTTAEPRNTVLALTIHMMTTRIDTMAVTTIRKRDMTLGMSPVMTIMAMMTTDRLGVLVN
jgi:hypothetical protein